ncbi:hypothetical protein AB0E69_18385 [Kribbella sp. NPDC026611]|uniref:hypothetical protein n=1 Tax=Kribbella sp. NPDC026611 TaxID=3154911 RepID=UPI003402EA0B
MAGQPDSVGQCGVSSAWLLHRLAWPARRNARYCFGDVLFSGSDEIAASHCWIEIGRESSARRLVIDLTFVQFDQFSRFEKLRDRAVLCEYYEDLTERSIEYKAVSRRRFKELRSDAVWPRYQILKRATSPAWRKAVRSFYLTRMAPWFRSLTIHQRVSGAFGAGAIQYGAA